MIACLWTYCKFILILTRLSLLDSYHINCMIHHTFTVPYAAVWDSDSTFNQLDLCIFALFRIRLNVKSKARNWTIVSNTLVIRPACHIFRIHGLYIKVTLAWLGATRTNKIVLVNLFFGSNRIFKGYSASLSAVSCTLYNILNDWVYTWDFLSILHMSVLLVLILLGIITLFSKFIRSVTFLLEAVTKAIGSRPNFVDELFRVGSRAAKRVLICINHNYVNKGQFSPAVDACSNWP